MKEEKKKKEIEEFDEIEETEVLDEKAQSLEEKVKVPPEETSLLLLKKAFLIAIEGPLTGKKFPVRFDITKIGRSEDFNHIVLPEDRKVSRRHATIVTKGGKYVIYDRRSRNRTYVNRRKIGEEEEVILNFGDEIEIGSTIFRFCEEGKEDFSPPRRAGSFWSRHKYNILRVISLAILSAFLYASYNAFVVISIVRQKPNPVQISQLNKKKVALTVNIDSDSFMFYNATLALLNLPKRNFNNLIFCNDEGMVEILSNRNFDKILPQISTDEIFDKTKGITLEDINYDGIKEIITITRNSQIRMFDAVQGLLIDKSEFFEEIFPPALADLDKDLHSDLIVVSKKGKVYFWFWFKKRCEIFSREDTFTCSPVIGDIDDDGFDEVVVIGQKGTLYIIDGRTQQLKEEIDLYNKLFSSTGIKPEIIQILAPPALGEINKRGGKEIVITCRHGDVFAVDGKNKNIIWHHNLFRKYEKYPELFPFKYASPILADFDLDGILDVLVVSLNGYIVAIKGTNGEILWAESLGEKEISVTTPALADIDKDGVPDIILGSASSGMIYFLNGKTGKLLYKLSTGSPITSSPVIGDIDGNSYLNVIFLVSNGDILLLETNTKVRKNEIIWAMENFDASRTNTFHLKSGDLNSQYVVLSITVVVIILTVVQNFLIEMKKRKRLKIITD